MDGRVGNTPIFEAARAQLEAEAYRLEQPPRKNRGPATAYSVNDVVQAAARDLQSAINELVAHRATHGVDEYYTTCPAVMDALRQIARLRRACADAEEAISQALVLSHVAAPALAHYRDMPTYSLNDWAADVWRSEGRSMYERDDVGED